MVHIFEGKPMYLCVSVYVRTCIGDIDFRVLVAVSCFDCTYVCFLHLYEESKGVMHPTTKT